MLDRYLRVLFLGALFFTFRNKVGGTATDSDLKRNLAHFEYLRIWDLSHSVVKRGLRDSYHPFNKIKEVGFNVLGREFRLLLSPKKGLFDPKFEAVEEGEDGAYRSVEVDIESFYTGRVYGELESHASVHLSTEGLITAKIQTPQEVYHVEPSWRFVPHHENGSEASTTMIAYRASDVLFSWNVPHPITLQKPHKACDFVRGGDEDLPILPENASRYKREIDSISDQKTRCSLLLVADHRFFRDMGGSNSRTTVNYLISLIDRVHKIYEETVWTDEHTGSEFSNMGFTIKRILVHRKATNVKKGELHYNMKRSSWDVRKLLEVFSWEKSHESFCLAHLFTDRIFDGGILGLAYLGSPRKSFAGGICTREFKRLGRSVFQNSGISSVRNHYGQRVITREADLVTAHEFGHNWGSHHDPDSQECAPSASNGGSFLMYTYSVSGHDVNNNKFSPCSLKFISKVLLSKSGNCFSESKESFCGNLRIEGDEECDAGLMSSSEFDLCCDKNCKLNSTAQCSDKNSPCCEGCNFKEKFTTCRSENLGTCEQLSYCNGYQALCPPSRAMRDGTPCIERGECRSGKCVPFCEIQGKQSCMCDTEKNACLRCCRERSNSSCFPVLDQRGMEDLLPDGTPCYQGFCNHGICEKTMQDVVERIWNFIDDLNISSVLKFLKNNIVGTIVFISLLFWIPCSCFISYVDRKRAEKDEEEWAWKSGDGLIHPKDLRRIFMIKVPRSHRRSHSYYPPQTQQSNL